MKDYTKEYREFSLLVPERFSFPLDVFDKWGGSQAPNQNGSGQALFWTDGSAEKRFTFNELKLLSSKGAGALKKMGINRGDKVLVMLPNIPEWWEVMLSLMRLNAIPIPATTLLTSSDIEYRLKAADIKAIITTDEDAAKAEDAVKYSSVNRPLLMTVGEGVIHYIRKRDKADIFEGERISSQ